MKDELFMMMLTLVFSAVLVVTGQAFIDHRNRAEAAAFLRSLAVSQARATPVLALPSSRPTALSALK